MRSITWRWLLWLLAAVLTATACDRLLPAARCEADSDCSDGRLCEAGECRAGGKGSSGGGGPSSAGASSSNGGASSGQASSAAASSASSAGVGTGASSSGSSLSSGSSTGTSSSTAGATGSSAGSSSGGSSGTLPGCLIGGTRYAQGTINPANTCQECDDARSASAWSPRTDGLDCAGGSVCSLGQCVAGCSVAGGVVAAGAADPSNSCRICDPSRSTTSYEDAPDGFACRAGRVCRAAACEQGCFVDDAFRAPGAANPNNPCQVCLPTAQTQQWSNADNGINCGNGQVCMGGACGAGCSIGLGNFTSGQVNPANPCQSCQPGVSTSAWTGLVDDTPCDNGSRCDGYFSCQAAQCTQVAPAVTCNMPPTCRTATGATCNPANGECTYPAVNEGSDCDNGDPCDGVSTCVGGGCVQTTPAVTCDSPPACRVAAGATCQRATGTCNYPAGNEGGSCDNGDLCDGISTCAAGTCTQTTPPVVCDRPPPCQTAAAASCIPSTGMCSYPVLASGTSCGTGRVCNMGSCLDGCYIDNAFYAPDAPDPTNACRSCQPTVMLGLFSPVGEGSPCADNGDACDGESTCQGGTCTQTTAPVTCDAPRLCQQVTGATCNPVDGTCTYPREPDGTPCGSGQYCFSGRCDPGCDIDGSIWRVGDLNPANACQVCSATNPTGWRFRHNEPQMDCDGFGNTCCFGSCGQCDVAGDCNSGSSCLL